MIRITVRSPVLSSEPMLICPLYPSPFILSHVLLIPRFGKPGEHFMSTGLCPFNTLTAIRPFVTLAEWNKGQHRWRFFQSSPFKFKVWPSSDSTSWGPQEVCLCKYRLSCIRRVLQHFEGVSWSIQVKQVAVMVVEQALEEGCIVAFKSLKTACTSKWQSDKESQVFALQSRYHILQLQREKHPSAKAFFPLDWQWASPCSSRRYWWTPGVKLQQCFTAEPASPNPAWVSGSGSTQVFLRTGCIDCVGV